MNSTRIWSVGAALLITVILALGWLLGISPKLAEAQLADAALLETQAVNAGHELRLAEIKEQFEGLDELKEELDELQTALPSGADLPDLLDELDALGRANQVSYDNFTASEAQAYLAPAPGTAAPPVPTVPAEPTETTQADTTEAAAAAEPAVPTTVADPASEAGPTDTAAATPAVSPLVTESNFVAVTITLQVKGNESNVMGFLDGLQSTDRLVLVTDFSLSNEGETAGQTTAQITGLIYVLLDPNAP